MQLPARVPPHSLRALRALGLSGYVFLQDALLAALAWPYPYPYP